MTDIEIISSFKTAVLLLYPEAEIFFYGSRVKGKHAQDSDYDVLVVVDKLNPEIREKIYECAWETGYAFDALIAPVICEKKEFNQFSDSPFYSNVKKTGLRL
jgi:predicted nucleotidyltransferase